jgi:16S rRNA (uracil1498-N3)-methyltransferase
LFFVPEVRGGRAELHGEDAKHLTRVLRVERGQVYQISDNASLYLAEVTAAHKESVEFTVIEKQETPHPPPELTLCAALIKFDHFEWMIEKAAELGVTRVVPVEAARSDKGLEKAAIKRAERWRRIALEASQQCRRPHLPVIAEPLSFERALLVEATCRWFADEEAAQAIPRCPPGGDAAVLIGPEGGWTAAERQAASSWTRVSLGRNVLRAETAALAALSLLSIR